MKRLKNIVLVLLMMSLALASFAGSGGQNSGSLPEVSDLLGLTPTTESSCIAIWVPVPENMAVAGMKWFNNDNLSIFPEILVESGSIIYPVSLSDCQVVAQNVTGESEQWSEVEFTEPVRCASEGLYVLFRFTEGSEYLAVGSGGGTAMGFCAEGGLSGWMSADGEDWFRVNQEFGFAASPIFLAAEDWMMQMNGVQGPDVHPVQSTEVFETGLSSSFPNPFNPSIEIEFSLAKASPVQLRVYDLHGRLVKEIVNEILDRGNHSATWLGRGIDGRRMGSGVYFAQLVVDDQSFVQKLVLVK